MIESKKIIQAYKKAKKDLKSCRENIIEELKKSESLIVYYDWLRIYDPLTLKMIERHYEKDFRVDNLMLEYKYGNESISMYCVDKNGDDRSPSQKTSPWTVDDYKDFTDNELINMLRQMGIRNNGMGFDLHFTGIECCKLDNNEFFNKYNPQFERFQSGMVRVYDTLEGKIYEGEISIPYNEKGLGKIWINPVAEVDVKSDGRVIVIE